MWILCFCLLIVNQACIVENAWTCTTGKKYCGSSRELSQFTVHGNQQDPQAIFVCLEDGKIYGNASCEGGLQCYHGWSDGEVHCQQPCKINKLYCGHQLAQMTGWNRSEVSDKSSTIFICDLMPHTDVVHETALQTCYLGCQAGRRRPTCAKCDPGRPYCSSELVNDVSIAKNSVYLCNANGTDMVRIGECSSCHQGHCCDQNSLYCGSLLPSSSSNSHFSDGLYKCGNGIYTLHMRCANSCIAHAHRSYCACVPSASYCFDELKSLGYSDIHSSISTYICENETRSPVTKVEVCSRYYYCLQGQCCKPFGQSLFCGSELMKGRGNDYLPDGLYECDTNFTLRMHCANGCIAKKPQSYCACLPFATYCGHELRLMGYSDSKYPREHGIYICQNETTLPEKIDYSMDYFRRFYDEDFRVNQVHICPHLCVQSAVQCCDRDSSFCGSELPTTRGNSYLPDGLYECSSNNYVLRTHCANGCIVQNPESYCACVPSTVYCDHEIHSLGFYYRSTDKSLGVYQCTNHTVTKVTSCRSECSTAGYVHCSHSCSVGSLYCGYENAVQQHQGLANRTDNALYLCTAEHYFLHQETCRRGCIDRDTNSECKSFTIDSPSCGDLNSEPEMYIRGGQAPPHTRWPFMVSVQNESGHVCGGVLIDYNWVLSAAHCAENNLSHIVHGQHNIDNPVNKKSIVNISSIVQHPTYNRSYMSSGDIVLIKLEKSVEYSQFTGVACLPAFDVILDPGVRCMVAGWGGTFNKGSHSNSLLQGIITIRQNSNCEQHFYKRVDVLGRDYTFDSKTMICAGPSNSTDVLPCKGDSGGPLFCQKPDFKWAVYGLVSYGLSGVCDTTDLAPTAFAKVSAFVGWIMRTVE